MTTLTDREIEVMTLKVEGCPRRQIARILEISDAHVQTHLKRVHSKYCGAEDFVDRFKKEFGR